MNLKEQVKNFINENEMVSSGDHLLVAVSGGADSVCLLLLLQELRQELGISLSVAHVEHGIRGEESRQDMAFVRDLSEKLSLPCFCLSCDAPTFSKDRGLSLEEAARMLRYELLEEARKKAAADKIVLAHNKNDVAETLLFQLLRGSSLEGMGGIAPVRGNLLRPLLAVERSEIEAYLQEKGQAYCTDSTNEDTAYSRNKLRHQVLPLLQEINPRAVEHLYQSSCAVTQAREALEEPCRAAYEACVQVVEESTVCRICDISETVGEESEKVPVALQGKDKENEKSYYVYKIARQLKEYPVYIQKWVVFHGLKQLAGSGKDLSRVHGEQVLDLFEKQVGRRVDLPYGMVARRSYEGILLYRDHIPEQNFLQGPVMIRVFPREENQEIPKKRYTKWFDYDRIKDILTVRTRQEGDFLVVNYAGDRQSLKKLFINEKVPASERDRMPLVAAGSHILWVVGLRESLAYPVTEETKTILELSVANPEEENG